MTGIEGVSSILVSELARLRTENATLRRRLTVYEHCERFRQAEAARQQPAPRFVDWRSGDRADQAPRPVFVAAPLL